MLDNDCNPSVHTSNSIEISKNWVGLRYYLNRLVIVNPIIVIFLRDCHSKFQNKIRVHMHMLQEDKT